MKTDFYTKTILTVIAICLTINVVKELNIIPQAHASKKITETADNYKLVPIGENNTLDVRIVDINTYDELKVSVSNIDTNDEMKVNISRINTSDELDVNIDEIGGSFVSMGGPIPVTTD